MFPRRWPQRAPWTQPPGRRVLENGELWSCLGAVCSCLLPEGGYRTLSDHAGTLAGPPFCERDTEEPLDIGTDQVAQIRDQLLPGDGLPLAQLAHRPGEFGLATGDLEAPVIAAVLLVTAGRC